MTKCISVPHKVYYTNWQTILPIQTRYIPHTNIQYCRSWHDVLLLLT